ncbi:unnamed protein product [Euphydryas editha]|uniref:Uncharacterized protein n=1 Tax=Euphydryas editha TaxID=104508 RepID=A0AAU9UWK6_EUPED|nr:unnamed protein product [Euphydryas editha]
MRCYICKATSKDFNNLKALKEVNYENLKFGLSVLHARIRFFKTLLHLSYKITVQKWQIRSQAEKDTVKERKKEIQNQFKTRLGLIVDVPKAGYGSSNDGNTSRRFFEKPQVYAEITGITLKLIERFSVILEVISSGHRMNTEKFTTYCHDTALLYVELYSWHPMSPTVHKAPWWLNMPYYKSEPCQKRQPRPEINNVLNVLLLTSDPYLPSIRLKPQKRSKPFSFEATEMLLPSEVDASNEVIESTEDFVQEANYSFHEEGWQTSD